MRIRAGLGDAVTRRSWVLGCVMLAMFTAAIEGTIVATAMPAIVARLGGFTLYSWVFSAFLLTQAVTTLIFGKLADLFGRKPVLTAGIVIFLVGSVACGFAGSMLMLIGFRFVQGIGAGAVQPIAVTLIGDLYSPHERARIQGYLSSVWGVSAVVGPLAGGLIVEYISWRWIFWLNVPFGLFAMLGLGLFLHERVEQRRRQIDYLGASLFFVAVSTLMMVLIEGGGAWGWRSPSVLLLLIVSAVGAVWFLAHERRADEPMMALDIWRDRVITLTNAAILCAGMMLIGLTTFLPTFVQGALGRSAIVAGFTLTAMSVGWPLAATTAGHLYIRLGPRVTARLGALAVFVSGLLFASLRTDQGPIWAGVASFIMGTGMGFLNTTFIVLIQSRVDWARRGVATSLNMFMRIIGSALGAAILGGVLNASLRHYLTTHGGNAGASEMARIHNLLQGPGHHLAANSATQLLRNALTSGLDHVFLGVCLFATATLVLTFLVPRIGEG